MSSQKTYAITGSASGMGAATCQRLRDGGHQVIGVDRREADIVVDLGTPEGRRAAIAAISEACDGTLDGFVPFAGLAEVPGRPCGDIVAVNYFGTVELLEGLRECLASADAPAAVAISSNSTTTTPELDDSLVKACLSGDEKTAKKVAEQTRPFHVYPATKTAVAHWVRRHAPTQEWIGAGITLNAVAPGVVTTAMTEEIMKDPTLGPQFEQFPVPAGRHGQPEELAALVEFLLGPNARFICGSLIFADGGTDALLRSDDWPATFYPKTP